VKVFADFTRSVIRLQMRFDAWYIRQANRRHGGLGLLAYIERTVSRAYAHRRIWGGGG
jgi:hypothetical protein